MIQFVVDHRKRMDSRSLRLKFGQRLPRVDEVEKCDLLFGIRLLFVFWEQRIDCDGNAQI